MKKLLTLIFALVLAVSCLAFTACGGSNVEGKYYFYQLQMTAEGVTTTFNVGDTAPWGDDVLTDSDYMELKADGVITSYQTVDGQLETMEGTYTISDGTITFVVNGQTSSGTIADGTITTTNTFAGTTMVYIYKK